MPITIAKISVINPGLFRHGADMDLSIAASRFLVHDSMEEMLELSEEFWIKVAQLCSVMSVYWIQGKVGVPFKSLSEARKLEIANVVIANNSPQAQFDWARAQLGYTQISDKLAAAALPAGTHVLLYTPRHVSAAIVGKDGKWLTYDPETASAEEYSVAHVTALYLDHCTSFLHGR